MPLVVTDAGAANRSDRRRQRRAIGIPMTEASSDAWLVRRRRVAL
jgi:hypothetical protein